MPTSQAGGEERNPLIRTLQRRQTPSAQDESHGPIESQPMLGGERRRFVGLPQQRSGLQASDPPRYPGGPERVSQCGGIRKPAGFGYRRVTLEQCLVEMSEARE